MYKDLNSFNRGYNDLYNRKMGATLGVAIIFLIFAVLWVWSC